jgi:hypothetical protein
VWASSNSLHDVKEAFEAAQGRHHPGLTRLSQGLGGASVGVGFDQGVDSLSFPSGFRPLGLGYAPDTPPLSL